MLKVESTVIDLDFDPVSRKYRVPDQNSDFHKSDFHKKESKSYTTKIKFKTSKNKPSSYKNLLEKKGLVVDFTVR